MQPEYTSQSIEHLGMVSAMFDELGIAEVINKNLEQENTTKIVNAGQAVKAMVLNGLGFTQRRLYLTPHFFANKPVESLIGQGIEAKHLNDDTLGEALDLIHGYGVNQLFNLIALRSIKVLGLQPKTVHDDITSFHVDGAYNNQSNQSEVEAAGLVRISRGYSRDSKPALNQVALELISEHIAGIPVAMQVLSGCENDKTAFQASVKTHQSHLQSLGVRCVIKDSAGYTTQSLINLQTAQQLWIMRVPNTIKAVKTWIQTANWTTQAEFKPLTDGYTYQIRDDDYAGVQQRWLLIHSQAAYKKEFSSTKKRLAAVSMLEFKTLTNLMQLEFNCESDARSALARVSSSLHHTQVIEVNVRQVEHYTKVGRPSKDSKAIRVTYQLELSLASQASALLELAWQGSLFVLGTNDLDLQALADPLVLSEYKGQQKVEGGFRFLKDPMFLASTIFLKKVSRVMALLMIMTVCLLVYAALEYRVRRVLQEHQVTVPDQKGKGTSLPTARWVFELMTDVHLLLIQGQERVVTLNLRAEVRRLLVLLGSGFTGAYP